MNQRPHGSGKEEGLQFGVATTTLLFSHESRLYNFVSTVANYNGALSHRPSFGTPSVVQDPADVLFLAKVGYCGTGEFSGVLLRSAVVLAVVVLEELNWTYDRLVWALGYIQLAQFPSNTSHSLGSTLESLPLWCPAFSYQLTATQALQIRARQVTSHINNR